MKRQDHTTPEKRRLSAWRSIRVSVLVVMVLLIGHYDCLSQNAALSLTKSDTIIIRSQIPAYVEELGKTLGILNAQLQKAREAKQVLKEGILLQKIASIYEDIGNSEEKLKHLLWAVMVFERAQAFNQLLEVKRTIADHYYQNFTYQKAIQYYQAYVKGKERLEEKDSKVMMILQKVARSYFLLGEYEQAESAYQDLITFHQEYDDVNSIIATYEALTEINKQLNNIPGAIQYLEAVEQIYRQQKDTLLLLQTLNNLGVLQKRNQNMRQATDYFQQAKQLAEGGVESQEAQVSILINIGVAYTNVGFFLRAKEAYGGALKLTERSGDEVEQAGLHNYLASNAYISRNNAQALTHANQAVTLAIGKNGYQELATSYRLLSLIYKEEKNKEKAQLYHQQYVEIQNRLKDEKDKKYQNLLNLQDEADTQEERLKAAIIEQEQLALDRERQQAALKIKEQELTLLRKNQALQQAELLNQQLERERAEQQLSLAQQALVAEKQKRELSDLEQVKELQELELEQQVLKQEQQEKAIALLETEKKLQEQKLQQEAVLRQYGYGFISLCVMIIGVVSYSFFQKRKDNQKLQAQQYKIQEQNEHLKASEQMLINSIQELENAQQILEKQKRQLEIEHFKTKESLQYAKRIQFSILPSEKESQSIFPENFVIFRPKDVVSGDFYWMSDHGSQKIVSVVDCTGHGVPGALVSLIAHNMLEEAINEKNILDPASILSYLNQQVLRRLREGDHSIQDGMDIGICMLEKKADQSVHLYYAGAKHTLFAVKDGSLITLKGERKTLGSIRQDMALQKHHMELQPGDTLYLTTDGFIDQSNPERRRFGSRKLKSFIKEVYTLPIQEQQTKFIEALETHQQTSEQRDDINLIGIKI
uniref:SpoIIE family protein phosphatase n=1 Tax=Roseihalotalea indica TaxID=2867963 RepID=A0AA49GQV2_9BACT|nr:SpoIIE family protein phosphatase [Tunicatimonas sp. TK19036]